MTGKSDVMSLDEWHFRERVGRLVKGFGHYIDDLNPPGLLHCALLNSPYSHALIKSVDFSKALRLPGVRKVLTGAELKNHMGPLALMADYSEMGLVWRDPKAYPLAVDRVRFVGEPVAVVAADDRYAASDAIDHISVEYEPLPAVADIESALSPGAPLLYPEWGSNVQCKFRFSTPNVAEVFASADRVVRVRWREARQSGFPLETRGTVAFYDKTFDSYLVYSSTQSPTIGRHVIARALQVSVGNVKVVAPDIGGGFGNKVNFTLEIIACLLAKLTGRPVKLVENRYQNIVMGPHQRDVMWEVEAAVKNTGELLGLRAKLYIDLGVEGNVRGCGAPSIVPATLSSPGAYKFKAVEVESTGVVTNKSFYDAYRGYGKDKGAKMIERVVDRVASELGLPPEQVRYINFIKKHEFPYSQITGYVYDSGNYEACLSRALQLLNLAEWRSRQEALRKKNEYLGIGMSLTLEPAGGAIPYSIYSGYESARIRVSEDGTVEVYSGWTDIGQGSIPTMAQITSEILGAALEDVKVYTGSSDYMGLGPYASRGIIYGGGVVAKAAKAMRDRILKIAGHMLECRPEDLETQNSEVYVKDDRTRKITFKQLCRAVYFKGQQKTLSTELMKQGLVPLDITVSWFSPLTAEKYTTYTTVSAAADACVVNVDLETGAVKILKYVSVHDCGKVVNREIVEGQLYGGLAQAIGACLYEEVVYDENATPLTSSFMDYLIPTTLEMNFPIENDHVETPSPFTELGGKGTGEASVYSGAITVANAVEDALKPFGVVVDSIPITPEKVRRWLTAALSQAP
ncbi:MAG: xanthine dehydrogenase family protein molybdopterin-binding subunit [Candidatus Caldarchaeum sp.]|nr:xanthine dehydrogenase family protein molybdopterin-binding subunit [Candidatus Caldarchaeum sp.]